MNISKSAGKIINKERKYFEADAAVVLSTRRGVRRALWKTEERNPLKSVTLSRVQLILRQTVTSVRGRVGQCSDFGQQSVEVLLHTYLLVLVSF